MSSQKEKAHPKRAHGIEISAGADTKEELIVVLNDIIWKVRKGIPQSITGGSSAGYWFEYKTDESMTREKYMEAIESAKR